MNSLNESTQTETGSFFLVSQDARIREAIMLVEEAGNRAAVEPWLKYTTKRINGGILVDVQLKFKFPLE